jgi:cell division protein FtsB
VHNEGWPTWITIWIGLGTFAIGIVTLWGTSRRDTLELLSQQIAAQDRRIEQLERDNAECKKTVAELREDNRYLQRLLRNAEDRDVRRDEASARRDAELKRREEQ